jgi:methylamine dehydrogenase heavy chain
MRFDRMSAGAPMALATLLCMMPGTRAALAADPLPSDIGSSTAAVTLPVPASKHWVWVNDFVFGHMMDGRAHLVDGDSGRYLGALNTGFSASRVVLASNGKVIYSPEVYFSRGNRGKRSDVVTLYDASTLAVITEIPIPPKRSSNSPTMANAVLTDDDRFLLIFNFNPGSSVSVVDTVSRKFVAEIETPGCALIYPTGRRSFFTLCGDGGAMVVQLNEHGGALKQSRTQPLFDAARDPVNERPVRVKDVWYFLTFDGRVVPIRANGQELTAGEGWWLTSEAERKDGWRPGGVQQLAVHAGQNRLYALMHQGNRDTHKDPGKDVWVYDLNTHQRVLKFNTRDLATSIQLSTDAQPLFYSVFADSDKLDIYDPGSGKLLRTVDEIGTTPLLLITP